MYCKSPNPLTISESGILATQISDHMATFVALNCNKNKNYKHLETVCTRSFTGNKMNCFLGELENINWPHMFDHDSAADPLITYGQKFSTKLDEMINIHFPLKVVKFNKHKHKKSKWMTHTLLTEIKKRDELYRSLNSTKPETYNYTVKEAELKIKVKEVRKLKRETKAEYYNLEFNKSKNVTFLVKKILENGSNSEYVLRIIFTVLKKFPHSVQRVIIYSLTVKALKYHGNQLLLKFILPFN